MDAATLAPIDALLNPGRVIRDLRKAAGLSQKQAAVKIGVPFQQLSAWERGVYWPGRQAVAKIRAALVESR